MEHRSSYFFFNPNTCEEEAINFYLRCLESQPVKFVYLSVILSVFCIILLLKVNSIFMYTEFNECANWIAKYIWS